MNLIGRRFGHIRVDRILGQGGMGDVYEGFDEKLARRVALKVLHHPTSQRLDDEARTRLTREARTLGRLDHPNICRIYDFIDDADVDILVLELIDGRTLQAAMREGPLSKNEKLRIAQAVADVLVAAHRAGIIHRDLKPENVMLTKSGEVKVLDFGLARWLERERRQSGKSMPAVTAVSAADALGFDEDDRWLAVDVDATAVINAAVLPDMVHATGAGITVGTPLFMSPEQARGETLTTASDVYSFGLMLQALFTGKEPYPEGLSAREVMLKAARGDSMPVNGGAPRSVPALIRAMKAFAPADRPTAVDTLRRIRFIVDTPKRYARQGALILALLVVAFSGWKYVTDLRRERIVAQQAEAEARRRRAQADSLIGFMLGDLRTKLEPVGRLDILDGVAERSLSYMSSLDPKTLSAEELARNSKALYQLGEVRIGQGRLTEATSVLKESLARAKVAADRDPTNEEFQLEFATSHFWLGSAYQVSGDLSHALENYQAYLDIAKQLSDRHPSDSKYRLERAYAEANVGTVAEAQGDLAGARTHYETSLRLKRDVAMADPANGEVRADVAKSLNKLGYVDYKLGNLSAALRSFEEEAKTYRDLLSVDAKDAGARQRLATSLGFHAWVLEALGQPEAALREYEEEKAIEERLVALDPANARWANNLAITTSQIGNAERMTGRVADALRVLADAERKFGDVSKRDPKRPAWPHTIANCELKFARALIAAGDVAGARKKLESAISRMKGLSRADAPTNEILLSGSILLGEIHAKEGHADRAREIWSGAALFVPKTSSGPRALEDRVHLDLLLGRAEEARSLAAQLRAMGYQNRDFVTLCSSGAC